MRQCRCTDPRACTCFSQNNPIPQRFYTQYPYPIHTPWPQQYSQAYVPYNDPAQVPQQFTFQNNFPASYGNNSVPSTSTTFRPALGDTTNTVNSAASTSRQTKRKRTAAPRGQNSEANTRRRLNCDVRPDAPAVFGVGPSTAEAAAAASAASEPVYHPSFTNIPGVNLGSLLDKAEKSSAAATDVWYFVRGVHSSAKVESLPEREVLSTDWPLKATYSHHLQWVSELFLI